MRAGFYVFFLTSEYGGGLSGLVHFFVLGSHLERVKFLDIVPGPFNIFQYQLHPISTSLAQLKVHNAFC